MVGPSYRFGKNLSKVKLTLSYHIQKNKIVHQRDNSMLVNVGILDQRKQTKI